MDAIVDIGTHLKDVREGRPTALWAFIKELIAVACAVVLFDGR